MANKGSLTLTSLFSGSVMSDSLRTHGLQHTRLPCPSPSYGACTNSCPFSRWCHPTISFSVVPFSSCLQSFPASGSFPVSWLFSSGGQSIGDLTSASVKSSRSVVSDSLWPHGLHVACQAPLSMGFSRQEYWSGLPFPSPGDLPDPGIEAGSPALQTDPLPSEPSGKPTSASVLPVNIQGWFPLDWI